MNGEQKTKWRKHKAPIKCAGAPTYYALSPGGWRPACKNGYENADGELLLARAAGPALASKRGET